MENHCTQFGLGSSGSLEKYFRGSRTRCLDNVIQRPNSAFLKLYAKAAPLIKTHSHWILGNGKKVIIWMDKTMNKESIENRASINTLRCWMDREGLRTLWDISLRNNDIWVSWKRIEVPDQFKNEWATLLDCLHGMAPTHMRKRDQKGWGMGIRGYVVSLEYIKLNE